MSNPTSNFGWQMPTNTDLVSQLPADFEVFGQAVDTSLMDLKGGTTGQVLSKASNTNMDFAWINADPLTILDAKGDLISATAADTPARLAVGTNGQVLTADSTTSTGLTWASPGTPSFVGAAASGNPSIPNTVYTPTAFTAEDFDTNGYHDNATNNTRITIPSGKAGYYLIIMGAGFPTLATTKVQRLYKNGANATWANGSGYNANINIEGNASIQSSYIMNLAVGDYIEQYVYQNSGGNANMVSYINIKYLGA
jgi:hypothetical protein